MNNQNFAFKLVCIDENNPIRYQVLDEVNKGNMQEIGDYLKDNYQKYDMNNCKWMIIPISKTK